MNKKEKTGTGFYRRYKTYIFVAAAAVFLLVALLAGLPYGIRYFVRQALIERGASVAVIEDVDFNPFTGRLVLHNIRVKADEALLNIPELGLRFRWWPLLKKRIYIKQLSLSGIRVIAAKPDDLTRLKAVIAGAGQKAGEDTRPSWLIGIEDLSITKSGVQYNGPDLKGRIEINNLQLKGLRQWEGEKAAVLDFNAAINNGKISFHGRTAPFATTPYVTGKLNLRGLSIEGLAPLARPDIKGLKGLLAMKVVVKASLVSAGKIGLTQKGEISLKNLQLLVGEREIKSGELVWKGALELRQAKGAGITGKGSLSLKGLRVDNKGTGSEFFEIKALKAPKVEVTVGKAGVERVEVEGIRLGMILEGSGENKDRDSRPLFSAASALLSGLEFKKSDGLRIRQLTFNRAEALLHRGTDGRWLIPEKTSSDKEALPFSIEEIKFSEGSLLRFEDDKVSPAYQRTLNISKAGITGLDKRRPGRKSAFTLEGTLEKYTKVRLTGTVSPFAKRPALELTGDLKNVDLPPLSAYTVSSGYKLTSGQMDASLKVKIENGLIDSLNELVLNKAEFSSVSDGPLGEIKKKLGTMPDVVLNLLRDRKDTVTITLPIKGDIADPEFDLNDIVFQAFYGAFMKSGFSYLKYYFQPWGTYITVGQIALKIAGEVVRIRLDPVFFKAGASALAESDMPYLEKVADLMKERPRIRLKLCGFAVTREGGGEKTSDEALLELALKRSTLIKDQLVKKYGIKPEALFVCSPEIDRAEEARARVELLI